MMPSCLTCSMAARVLQESVPPAGPQNTPDFADDLPGIGDRAQQKAGDDGIHRLVIEVDCIAGYAADLDVDTAADRTPLKCAVHVGVGLDDGEAASGRQVAEVSPDTRPDLNKLRRQPGEDRALVIPDKPVDVTAQRGEKPGVKASPHEVRFEGG
jgi:hypothetical protein